MEFYRCMVLLAGCCLVSSAVIADDVNVILLGGQSNMVGRASARGLENPLSQPQTDVGLFYSGGGSLAANTWIDLTPGSGTDFGPEVTLGRTLADRFPSESFALIKHAEGGTSLHTDWDPNTGGEYATFTDTVQAGLQAIIDAGDTPNIVGMAWLQGERDAVSGRTQSQYAADLTEFISAVRSDFAGGAELPFIIGRLSDKQFAGTNNAAGREAIQAAQDEVASTVAGVGTFNTDTLTLNDDRHFDAAGQQAMGTLFAQTWVSVAPEPSSLSALLCGGLLLIRRRRAA